MGMAEGGPSSSDPLRGMEANLDDLDVVVSLAGGNGYNGYGTYRGYNQGGHGGYGGYGGYGYGGYSGYSTYGYGYQQGGYSYGGSRRVGGPPANYRRRPTSEAGYQASPWGTASRGGYSGYSGTSNEWLSDYENSPPGSGAPARSRPSPRPAHQWKPKGQE
ncbi:unnamed protein product [Cladocopium goreaui]|uniref:Uncharacterized protein n=1 Tax=Cladocopium goreaui TaxID=2562237 RepID=A0A9P1DCQ0_9DINO|nr:unnamed protein product [Cladocopium goreaui]